MYTILIVLMLETESSVWDIPFITVFCFNFILNVIVVAFAIIAATLFPRDTLHCVFIKERPFWGTLWVAACNTKYICSNFVVELQNTLFMHPHPKLNKLQVYSFLWFQWFTPTNWSQHRRFPKVFFMPSRSYRLISSHINFLGLPCPLFCLKYWFISLCFAKTMLIFLFSFDLVFFMTTHPLINRSKVSELSHWDLYVSSFFICLSLALVDTHLSQKQIKRDFIFDMFFWFWLCVFMPLIKPNVDNMSSYWNSKKLRALFHL